MKSCPTCYSTYPPNYTVCPVDSAALVEVGAWSEGTLVRGKYKILAKVGQGGMGSVYKALHVHFEELRALKVMSPELAADPLFVRRFKQEAVITRKLQHANAVRVEDIDQAEDGRPFIVMEYIEGRSLKDVIQQEAPMPVARVCSIAKQVAAALNVAHSLGMVHRDIKPANIVLVTPSSSGGPRPLEEAEAPPLAKVLDFGIAKIKEAHLEDSRVHYTTLTGTGMIIGTPAYMSPEQAMGRRGDELDGRSDLYSLGVVMYQMLAGELPLKADSEIQLMMAQINVPPTPIRSRHPEIPEPIASLVMTCLEKNRDQRPATGSQLIELFDLAETEATPRPAEAATELIPAAAQGMTDLMREGGFDLPPSPLPPTRTKAINAQPTDFKPYNPGSLSHATQAGNIPTAVPQPVPVASQSSVASIAPVAVAVLVNPAVVTGPGPSAGPRPRRSRAWLWALALIPVAGVAWVLTRSRQESGPELTKVSSPSFQTPAELPPSTTEAQPETLLHENIGSAAGAGVARKDKPVPGAGAASASPPSPSPTVSLSPTDAGGAARKEKGHAQRARELLFKGDWDGAIAEYRRAVRLNPNDAEAHANLGVALGAEGDWDGEIKEEREAVSLHPKFVEAHNNLGFALGNEGDWEGEIREAREAIRLNPNYLEAHHNLGWALEHTGDQAGALEQYRRASELDPKDPSARGNYDRLLKQLNQ